MSGKNRPKSKGKACKKCGALLPKESSICLVCNTDNSKPDENINNESSKTISIIPPAKLRREQYFPRLIALILALGLAVSAVVVGAFTYLSFQRLKSQYNAKDALVYRQGENNLKIMLDSFPQPKTIRTDYSVNTSNSTAIKESYDHRYIAYLNNQQEEGSETTGELFLLDLTQLGGKTPSTAGGIKIASESVTDFVFSPSGNSLVFLTQSGDMYICDYSWIPDIFASRKITNTLIAKDVKGLGNISGENLLYYKGTSANSHTLDKNREILKENTDETVLPMDMYYIDYSSPSPKETHIADDVINILAADKNYNQLLYLTADTSTDIANLYSIYLHDATGNYLIDSGIYYIADSNYQSGALLYLKPNDDELSFEFLFRDDIAVSDATIFSPDELEAEPSEEEQEEYDQQLLKYDEKLIRDSIRSKLRLEIRDFKLENHLSYTLLFKSGWKQSPQQISTNIYNLHPTKDLVVSDIENGCALFVSGEEEEVEKIKFSQLDLEDMETLLLKPLNLEEHLAEHMPETLVYTDLETMTSYDVYSELGEKVIASYEFFSESNEIAFISKSNYNVNSGTLYSADITPNGVGKILYIDELVSDIIGSLQQDNFGSIVYQTASRDQPPQYIIYVNFPSGITEIAGNTTPAEDATLLTSGQKLIYFKNKNISAKTADMYLFDSNDRSNTLLETKVKQYLPLENGEIALIKSIDGKYTLKWLQSRTSDPETVDENVSEYQSFNADFLPKE